MQPMSPRLSGGSQGNSNKIRNVYLKNNQIIFSLNQQVPASIPTNKEGNIRAMESNIFLIAKKINYNAPSLNNLPIGSSGGKESAPTASAAPANFSKHEKTIKVQSLALANNKRVNSAFNQERLDNEPSFSLQVS